MNYKDNTALVLAYVGMVCEVVAVLIIGASTLWLVAFLTQGVN